MRFYEDNSGFIFFPMEGAKINIITDNKTIVYIVAFEPNSKSSLSSIILNPPGDFVSDDVVERTILNDVVKNDIMKSNYDSTYFHMENDKTNSISMVAAIAIGWSENAYEFRNGSPWRATFRDLTEEGKKLYYSMKKLHNNKEIRILTFNNI